MYLFQMLQLPATFIYKKLHFVLHQMKSYCQNGQGHRNYFEVGGGGHLLGSNVIPSQN